MVPFTGRWDCDHGDGEEDSPGSRGREAGLVRVCSKVLRRLSGHRGTGAGKGSQALEHLRQDISLSSRRSGSRDRQDKERRWEEGPGDQAAPHQMAFSAASEASAFSSAELGSCLPRQWMCPHLSSFPLETTSGLSCEARPLLHAPSGWFCLTSSRVRPGHSSAQNPPPWQEKASSPQQASGPTGSGLGYSPAAPFPPVGPIHQLQSHWSLRGSWIMPACSHLRAFARAVPQPERQSGHSAHTWFIQVSARCPLIREGFLTPE